MPRANSANVFSNWKWWMWKELETNKQNISSKVNRMNRTKVNTRTGWDNFCSRNPECHYYMKIIQPYIEHCESFGDNEFEQASSSIWFLRGFSSFILLSCMNSCMQEQPQYKVNMDKDLINNGIEWLTVGTTTKETKWSINQTKEIEIKKRKQGEKKNRISKQQLFQS